MSDLIVPCFERVWAMPNKWTFTIKPIAALLREEMCDRHGGDLWLDPFAGKHSPAQMTNDLDPDMPTMYHEEAVSWLRHFDSGEIAGVLFDPPYSPRQVAECYRTLGRTVTMADTQAKFWAEAKDEVARVVRPGGKVISCGWNSNGIGKTRGFTLTRILLVAHGGMHADTIVTVEVKA